MNEKQKKKMETKARLLKRLSDYVERKKAMDKTIKEDMTALTQYHLSLDWHLVEEINIPEEFERKYVFVSDYECNSETLVLFMFLKNNILHIDIKKYHTVTADIRYKIGNKRSDRR